MQLSPAQQLILKQMGIDVWVARCVLPGAKLEVYARAYQLSTADGQSVGWLLLDEPMTPEAEQLLAKMLAAFKFHGKNLDVVDLRTCTFKKTDLIWAMGDVLYNKLSALKPDLQLTRTPSLSQCLIDRYAKKQVWETINHVRNR